MADDKKGAAKLASAISFPDMNAASQAKRRMLTANPDTGMEVPQSEASISASRKLLQSIFGPMTPPAPGRQPQFTIDDPRINADVLEAWQMYPDLVDSVDWRSQLIPDKGVRAYLEPQTGLLGGGRGRITASPDFKHQQDNIWHELSHVVGLEDFGKGVTAHDVTEASRRANRPRDINLPRK